MRAVRLQVASHFNVDLTSGLSEQDVVQVRGPDSQTREPRHVRCSPVSQQLLAQR